MSTVFNLYSSEGCHLCELAMAICQPLIVNKQLNIIDIVENEALVERYGVHIPVLERVDELINKKELYWPFNEDQVNSLLK
ncbi:MAG: glutaredoxin family protein [Colwellia sp.]|nr:glutaredoxin family protein [Colwellia sp.]